jgi:hypothetical protein
MQAGDLKTLLSLQQTSISNPDTDYRSSSDTAELAIISQGQGLGMELYDDGVRDADEFFAAAEELGIPIERD